MTNMKQQLMNDIFNTSTDGLQRETWRKVKLGDIANIERGKRLVKRELSEEKTSDTPYKVIHGGIKPLGFYNQYNRKGHVTAVINTGNAGDVHFIDEDFWASDACYCLRAKNTNILDDKYIYYSLLCNNKYLYDNVRRSAMPTLSADAILDMEIILPPLSIQHKISSILSAYDSLISSTDDKSSNLRLAKQQLMNNIFSERESNKNLVFTDTWRKVKLGDLVKFTKGRNPASYTDGTGRPVVGAPEIDKVNPEYTKYTLEDNLPSCVETDTLILWDGSKAGNIGYGHNAVLSSTIMKLEVLNKNELDSKFLNYLVYTVQDKIEETKHGAAIPHLDRSAIADIDVYLPSLPEQLQISSILSDYDMLIESERESVKAFLEKQRHSSCRRYSIEYKKVKLGDVITECREKNKRNLFSEVRAVTNTDGLVDPLTYFNNKVASDDLTGYKVVKPLEFAYNPARINVGSIGMLKDDKNVVVSPMYVVFKCDNSKLRSRYLWQFIKSDIAHTKILEGIEPGIRARFAFDAMQRLEIAMYSIEQQDIIVDMLESFDSLIDQYKSQLDTYNKIKEQLMTDIFS